MAKIAIITLAVVISISLATGRTVKEKEEPKQSECGKNEVYGMTGSCEAQCNRFRGEKCGPDITKELFERCICQPGFLRIEGGKCIEAASPECGGEYDLWKDWIKVEVIQA